MTKSDSKKASIIWNIFSSIRLTLVLLIILAVTSIFGTIIPQQEGAMEFAKSLSPWVERLFSSLQLFDMYHSLWFRMIIALLVLNLVVCSINRLPTTLRLFRTLPRPDRSKPFENLPSQRSFSVEGEIGQVAAPIAEVIRNHYRNMMKKNTEKGDFLYGEKGRYSRFGVYLIHLSILFILIGAIIGSLFGFKAYVNIAEGETVETAALRKVRGHKHKNLGFGVHCEKFTVDFYDSGTPKEYRSDLIFIDNGKVLKKGSLLVNHPITFRGITFYQSSYGTTPGERVRLKISRHLDESETTALEIEAGYRLQLPGNEGLFQVIDVHENLKGIMGPAALISIKPLQGEEIRFWVFKNLETLRERFPKAMLQAPMFNASAFKPYTFYLDGIESKYYTGLQVNRDPGVPFVWTGFFMIMIGLFITFFTSHRRVWVRVTKEEGKIRISVAGSANKNPVGMERELDQLTHKLQTQLDKKRHI